MPKIFTGAETKVKRKYVVRDFLALGTMSNILSQAGVGKTYFAFELAVDVALGKKFLGMDVGQMKVLIIDQDQSEDETEFRLKQFMDYHEISQHENLMISCMEGLSLKDGTLLKTIKSTGANLTIIDTMTAVCSGLDMNNSKDMQKLKDFYQECIDKETTVVFLHHISEKKSFTFNDAMTCDPSQLAMFSSVINGAMDGYYVLYNPNKGKGLNELIIRPVMKRFPIKTGIIKTGLIECDNTLHFTDSIALDLDANDLATSDEQAILNFFVDKKDVNKNYYVKDIFDDMKGFMGINTVRTTLESLFSKGMIIKNIGGSNKYSFQLTEKGLLTIEPKKDIGVTLEP